VILHGAQLAKQRLTKMKKWHPEQEDDEIYMGNGVPGTPCCGWKTKRFGSYPFDCNGKAIYPNYGLYPIFVKRDEIEAEITRRKENKGVLDTDYLQEMLDEGNSWATQR